MNFDPTTTINSTTARNDDGKGGSTVYGFNVTLCSEVHVDFLIISCTASFEFLS